MADHRVLYLDGDWVPATGPDTLPVRNPATEELIGSVPAGTAAEVDRAVAAAARAFPAWNATSPAQRGAALAAIRDGLVARQEEIAHLISSEMGSPLTMARQIQTGLPISVLGSYVELLADYPFSEQIGNSTVVREGVGVVAAITPWNYPLHQVVAKLAAALAAGCTVVLKPSELTPLCVYALFGILDGVGLPPGVVNLVPGTGVVVGEALAGHPDVDMVSFTGSTRAGSRVAELAGRAVHRVALELGGKSANLVLEDADLATAVKVGVGNAFLNSGQTCTAWTRLLVPQALAEQASEMAAAVAAGYVVGDPMAAETRLGPLVSAAQRARVRGFISGAVSEGAVVLHGGADAPDGLERGWYVRPTVLGGVRPEMTVAREEVFGPVLSVLGYDGGDDGGVELANATDYGLAGGVWSGDPERAVAVAKRIRTGQVDINGGRFNPLAPFGGYKRSGFGRELGRFGLEEFLQVKSLQR